MPRPLYLVRRGDTQLRVAQLRCPEDSLLVRIEHPLTCTGPSLLLPTEHVTDLRNTLNDWLCDGNHADRIASAILTHAHTTHPGIPNPTIRARVAVNIARNTP